MLLSSNINVVWSLSLVLIVSDFVLIIPDDANESCTTPADSGRLRRLPGTPVHLGHCTSEVNWDTYTCGGTTHVEATVPPLDPPVFPCEEAGSMTTPVQTPTGLRSALAHPSFISSPSSNSIRS